ncbi:type II toxin-antitoxin system RelE/ParE family toxin [Candidatus Phycosocius spiralis]|uniref:Protein killer gene system toxin n=1 Tax=Candidatus Phycosocius spiralis TaxID=2815099 RepID=A0ABQ4PYA5_9PROT|nr:type II toxin-antitoxin system RelE/ParE family toxin [Candidatus Phycosocius spiralis]GIU68003.1 protein killer gene system toxin [Candidatus Phycosocius spiralis]
MEIGSVRHKALLAFLETGKSKGLPGNLVERLRRMLVWLDAIDQANDLYVPPNYGAHQLGGDRAGVWSLTVSRNWRMTFQVSESLIIEDLDLEDYH